MRIQKLFDTDRVHPALLPFFGIRGNEDLGNPKFRGLFEDASAINHATVEDPPVFLFYPQANAPLPRNSTGPQHIHHPKFGFVLQEKMDELGVECVLKLREDYRTGGRRAAVPDCVKFLEEHLKQR